MMSPEEWELIVDQLEELRNLPKKDRRKKLKELKQTNGPLHKELKSLLQEDKKTHPLLQNQFMEWKFEDDNSLIGTEIGPYRLKSILGTGGMGSVFLGERVDGEFEQQVAIKLVRPGLYEKGLETQLKEERAILAELSHPAIGKLYDGGTSSDGRIYFIMEYIDGLPLDKYLESSKLPIKERLELFRKICEGISFAHNKLILHLDIKPSNILIRKDGNLKLLDFGISMKIPDEIEGELIQEDNSQRKYTLAFASPEQLNKKALSIRSDVYSLGTLLYYMITLKLPYGEVNTTKADYLKKRNSTTVTAPSKVVRDAVSTQLKGDLDDICLKALESDPDSRYDSVKTLSDDVNAYLEKRPISLKTKNGSYVFGKLIQRHKATSFLTVFSLAAIIGLVSFYTYSLNKEKNKAIAEATKKKEVVDLMTGLFSEASPFVNQGEQITVDTFMENAAKELLTKDDIDPEVKGDMLNVLGDVFIAINNFSMADSVLFLAEDLYEKENITGALKGENFLNIGNLKYQLGEYAESESYYEKSTQIFKDIDEVKVAEIQLQLGYIADANAEWNKADSLYFEVKNIYEKTYSPPNANLADVYNAIGISKRMLQDYDLSKEYYESSLKMKRELYDEPHTEIAYTLNHLASLHLNMGIYDVALEYAQASLDQREKTLGPNHMETIASASNMGRIMRRMEQYEEAIPHYQDILIKMKNLFGESHHYVSSTYASIGHLHRQIEKWDSSLYYYDQAMDVLMGLEDVNERFKAVILAGQGMVYYTKGEYGVALPYLKENYEIKNEVFLEDNQELGLAKYYYGKCLFDLKIIEEARELLVSAKEILMAQGDKYSKEVEEIDGMLE